MITSITIITPDKAFFEVGQKLIREGKETETEVVKIKVLWGKVKIYLSDGKTLTYKGFPIIYN